MTSYNGYWRRCAQRMDQSPSETVLMNSKNGGSSVVVQFLHPLVISKEEANTTVSVTNGNTTSSVAAALYNLELAYSLEGVIRGNVKPFNGGASSASATGFYDLSDGFYQVQQCAGVRLSFS